MEFAKLTAEQVLEIYKLAWAGDLLQREIAERFGVARTLVSNIKHGKCWAETPDTKRFPKSPKPEPKKTATTNGETPAAKAKPPPAARKRPSRIASN